MAVFDGSRYNGLSDGFRQLLQRRKPLETIIQSDGKTTQRIWSKEDRPTYQAQVDSEKRLVEESVAEAAQRKELLPALAVRILGCGADLTVDDATEFEKQVFIEGLRGRDTVLHVKSKLAEQEGIDVERQRLFLLPHELRDEMKLGDCFVQWAGFGLDNWPPKFVMKRGLKGFELDVDVPACRDTAVWELAKGKQKLKHYARRRLTFDLLPGTTLAELKGLVECRLGVPASRQLLSAEMVNTSSFGYTSSGSKYFMELNDECKTMEGYGIDQSCVLIHLRINRFDENGDFIFENDAYWDHEGFHPAAAPSWIPQNVP